MSVAAGLPRIVTPPGGHFLLANFSQKFDQKLCPLSAAPSGGGISETPPGGQFLLDFL
jgi:hypothetical protein